MHTVHHPRRSCLWVLAWLGSLGCKPPPPDPDSCEVGEVPTQVCQAFRVFPVDVDPPDPTDPPDCSIECVPVTCEVAAGQGQVEFVHHFDPGSDIQAVVTAIDSQGRSYVAGKQTHGPLWIWSFAPDGTQRWVVPLYDRYYYTQMVATPDDDIVLAGPRDLFAIDESGNVLWTRAVESGQLSEANLAVAPDGEIAWGGSFTYHIDMGLGLYEPADASDIYLSKLASDGTVLWDIHYGGLNSQDLYALEIDASGDILMTGTFGGQLNLGLGAMVAVGSRDMYLARLAPNGGPRWNHSFALVDSVVPFGMDIDPVGDIVVGGIFDGVVDLGSGPIVAGDDEADAWLGKFDPDGASVWTRSFGGVSIEQLFEVETDPCGNIAIAGNVYGLDGPMAIDFGGGPLLSNGGFDVFVAKLDGDGNHLHSHLWGASTNELDYPIAVAPDGRVVVPLGLNAEPIDFGTGPVQANSAFDLVVIGLTP